MKSYSFFYIKKDVSVFVYKLCYIVSMDIYIYKCILVLMFNIVLNKFKLLIYI